MSKHGEIIFFEVFLTEIFYLYLLFSFGIGLVFLAYAPVAVDMFRHAPLYGYSLIIL